MKPQKLQNAIFGQISPIVPTFFRIGIRFERIPGRSAQFAQNWHFSFLPLLKELSRTSQGSFGAESDSKESGDVRLELLQKWHFFVLPLLGELSKSSRDSWESDSDSNESRDDRLHSFKSGVLIFLRFWVNFFNKNVSSTPSATIFVTNSILQGRVIRAPDNSGIPFTVHHKRKRKCKRKRINV